MKIRIRNRIQMDEQVEQIDQSYAVDWTQKGAYHYLLFKNEEGEKVVLKLHDEELVMTRFSTPKSLMRFIKGGEALVGIPTPIGMQQFITKTSYYQVDLKKQTLELHYQLRTPDGERTFADYQMEISWR